MTQPIQQNILRSFLPQANMSKKLLIAYHLGLTCVCSTGTLLLCDI